MGFSGKLGCERHNFTRKALFHSTNFGEGIANIIISLSSQRPNGRRYRQGRELAGKTTRRRIRRWGQNPESVGERPHLSGARDVCDLFARNCPQGWRMSGESRFMIFATAYPCRSMIPQACASGIATTPASLMSGRPSLPSACLEERCPAKLRIVALLLKTGTCFTEVFRYA